MIVTQPDIAHKKKAKKTAVFRQPLMLTFNMNCKKINLVSNQCFHIITLIDHLIFNIANADSIKKHSFSLPKTHIAKRQY